MRHLERRLIRRHVRLHFDGDWWGTVVSCLFCICYVLNCRGVVVPDEWGYHPGNMPTPESVDSDMSYGFELFYNQELVYFGNVMNRLADKLKEQGRSY